DVEGGGQAVRRRRQLRAGLGVVAADDDALARRDCAAVRDPEAADPNDGGSGRLLARELRRVGDVDERVSAEVGVDLEAEDAPEEARRHSRPEIEEGLGAWP